MTWIRKSAEQDGVYALLYLGRCYYEGRGVSRDYKQAVEYFHKAKEEDISGAAAFLLSKCYRFGRGVPADVAKADSLLKEATEKGWNEAKSLDDLLKNLY